MNLYENIKARRKELGMSQSELAQLTGYTDRTSISKIEAGKVDLPQSKIRAIAKALNTTEGQLMGSTESEADRKPSLPSNVDLKLAPNDAVPYNPTRRIPILGRISAGLPLYADEHIEGYTYTELNHGQEYFALRVHGDSMNALGIHEGYLVIVRCQEFADPGDIAVVMVGDDDEATMKRYYQDGDIVTLMPQSTNPEHKPQIYDARKTHIQVIGKVIEVKFTVR